MESIEKFCEGVLHPFLESGRAWLECAGCGASSEDLGSYRLVEHAMHDHVQPESLLLVQSNTIVTGYELNLILGGHPRTEAEEKWRASLGAAEG